MRLERYVRARLHRRIFLWFGASILVTVLLVGGGMSAVTRAGGSWWAHELERARLLTGHAFERVWDDPAARSALARDVAVDLDVGLVLSRADQSVIASFGRPCRGPLFTAPVVRSGVPLGSVALCSIAGRQVGNRGTIWFLGPLVVMGVMLWAASGAITRRLSRPLSELARVAQEIGAGKLSSRVRLDCHQHGEIGVVGEAMNDMAARIERQMADQRELLAAVSHELRTPLARIRLLTEIARDRGATERTLDEVDREVMEIDALVGDLLASSRIDFAALVRRPLDAEEAARRALDRAGLPASLLVNEAPSARTDADATLLGRALANLIDNAQKHGGGVVRLRVAWRSIAPRGGSAVPSRVAFEVEDDGPGFAPGDEARIFEPFYKRERGGRDAGSLGLGLALIKRIAEAHGGVAYAETREGGGARVGIELPIASAA